MFIRTLFIIVKKTTYKMEEWLHKWYVQYVCAPNRGSRRESVPCLLELLMAAGTLWLVAASLQSQSHCLLLFCV